VIKRAVVSANRNGREILGFIVDNGHLLELIQCNNKSKQAGSFSFFYKEARAIVKAARCLKHEVVGTFHSHPAGLATPGDSDIAGAENDSLMLIVDCLDRRADLWHVKDQKVRKLHFERVNL